MAEEENNPQLPQNNNPQLPPPVNNAHLPSNNPALQYIPNPAAPPPITIFSKKDKIKDPALLIPISDNNAFNLGNYLVEFLKNYPVLKYEPIPDIEVLPLWALYDSKKFTNKSERAQYYFRAFIQNLTVDIYIQCRDNEFQVTVVWRSGSEALFNKLCLQMISWLTDSIIEFQRYQMGGGFTRRARFRCSKSRRSKSRRSKSRRSRR
jgi:hypothetical protein